MIRSVSVLTMTAIAASANSWSLAAGPCAPAWSPQPGMPGIADSSINGMHLYNDGISTKLYAVGGFTSATGVAGTANIAAWNGTTWESVGGGLGGGQYTNALEVFQGELYAGGYFSNAGGVADTEKIAKWNGAAWSSINAMQASFLDSIWDLLVWDDGNGEQLYIAGNYIDMGGHAGFDHITKFDGTNFTQVGGGTIAGAGIPLISFSLTIWDDGTGEALYMGGRFSSVAGVPANRIAKWDGTNWTALGTGLSGSIATSPYDMVEFDGSLYIGGQSINNAGGTAVQNVARWDGMNWHAVGDGLAGTVWDLAVYDSGDGNGPSLYAVGLFTQSGGGTPIDHVARLIGNQWVDAGSAAGANCYYSLVVEDGDAQDLYVGGNFSSAAGTTCNRLVRLDGCPIVATCPADLADPAGTIDVFDLFVLLGNWGTSGPGAELADPVNNVDVFDLFVLLSAWGDC